MKISETYKYVTVINGKIVCRVYIRKFMNKDEVELFRLHTSKAYRRKGYATKLVDLVCLLYQLSPIKLRVGGNEEINSNDLMNFYSTFGFVRVGESKTMIKQ